MWSQKQSGFLAHPVDIAIFALGHFILASLCRLYRSAADAGSDPSRTRLQVRVRLQLLRRMLMLLDGDLRRGADRTDYRLRQATVSRRHNHLDLGLELSMSL